MNKAKSAATPTARLWEIDTARGCAVVLMVFFHFMWDMRFFGLSQVDVFSSGWQTFARSIGSSFLLLLGLSLSLLADQVQNRKQLQRMVLRRGLTILAWGMLITLVTFLALGAGYVRFGILHLLGTALIVALPFLAAPLWLVITTSIVMAAIGFWLNGMTVAFPWLIWLGLTQTGVAMVDYYPLLPWGAAAVLGVAVGRILYPAGQRRFTLPDLSALLPIRVLRWLGRHSLTIYLLHQPLLLGILWLVTQIVRI